MNCGNFTLFRSTTADFGERAAPATVACGNVVASGSGIWPQQRKATLDEVRQVTREESSTTKSRRLRAATASMLEESERRFRATFEQSAVGMAHMHRSGRFLRVNSRLCEILGYTREELTELTFQEITHPDDLESDLELARRLISGAIPSYSLEKRYIRRDGTIVWSNLTVSPVRDESGDVEYYAIVVEDILRRIEAAERLRREQELNRNLVDTAHAAIVILDMQGRIVLFNRFLEDLTGYSSAEAEGRNWIEMFIAPEDRERIQTALDGALDGERTRGNINAILTRDGRRPLIEWYDSPLTDEAGHQVAVLAIGVDVTEREHAHKRLREADRLAAVGNLASGISHDMSNLVMPMASIISSLERSPFAPQLEDALSDLRHCATSLMDLCQGLRQIVRGDAKEGPTPFNLDAWWHRVLPLLRAARPRTVSLQSEFEVPGAAVCVREGDLTRAVLNLVVNAAEAIQHAGRNEGEIVVRARRDADLPDAIQISVSDDGPGISPEIQDRIFEPFFSTKTRGLSTGMGLAMVKAFAAESNGSIRVQSEIGSGTTIAIRLLEARVTSGK